jgi:hypothetical protein
MWGITWRKGPFLQTCLWLSYSIFIVLSLFSVLWTLSGNSFGAHVPCPEALNIPNLLSQHCLFFSCFSSASEFDLCSMKNALQNTARKIMVTCHLLYIEKRTFFKTLWASIQLNKIYGYIYSKFTHMLPRRYIYRLIYCLSYAFFTQQTYSINLHLYCCIYLQVIVTTIEKAKAIKQIMVLLCTINILCLFFKTDNVSISCMYWNLLIENIISIFIRNIKMFIRNIQRKYTQPIYM